MAGSARPETVSILERCSSDSASTVSVKGAVSFSCGCVRFRAPSFRIPPAAPFGGEHPCRGLAAWTREPSQRVLFRGFSPRKAPDDSSPSASPVPLTDARSPGFPGCHERRPRLRGLVPCEDALRRFVLPRRSSLPSSGRVLPQDFAPLPDTSFPACPLVTFPPSVFASDGLGHAVFSVFQKRC
jgi:hypothetical protein